MPSTADRRLGPRLIAERRPRVRALLWAVALTVVAGVVALLAPGHVELVAVVWAVLLGVVALFYVTAVMLRDVPLEEPARREIVLPSLRRRPADRERVPGLTELERMVVFGSASAYDFESRLRPRLVAIAEQRLETHGATLRSPRAPQLLGRDAWTLCDPERPPLDDRRRHGVPAAVLARAVEALDAL